MTMTTSKTKPDGSPKTRGEFLLDLIELGMTVGEAVEAADEAGFKRGYHISHEQMVAMATALSAARGALSPALAGNPAIRADALEKVEAAFSAFDEADKWRSLGPRSEH